MQAENAPLEWSGQAGWDKWGATFRHVIEMLPNAVHPTGRKLVGYSKSARFSEKLDKMAVFKGYVDRIWFDWDYRSQATSMQIYFQNGPVKSDHPLLVTLLPNSFKPEPCLLSNPILIKWLTAKFNPNHVQTGGLTLGKLWDVEEVKRVEAEARKREIEELLFTPLLASDPLTEAPLWDDRMALSNYCTNLMKLAVRPRGAVEAFWRSMLKKYPQYDVK